MEEKSINPLDYTEALTQALSIAKKTAVGEFSDSSMLDSFLQLWERLERSLWLICLRNLYRKGSGTAIDSSGSGLVQLSEFISLDTAREKYKSLLTDSPTLLEQKKQLVAFLGREKKLSESILAGIATLVLLEKLNEGEYFHFFTFGGIKRTGKRQYECLWGGIEPTKNSVNFTRMVFDYSGHDDLTENFVRQKLFDLIKSKGNFDRGVGQLGAIIDDEIEEIHPKHIHRISIDNFMAKGVLPQPQDSEVGQTLFQYGDEGEFVVLMHFEEANSMKQVVSERRLLSPDKLQEVWNIPPSLPYKHRDKLIARYEDICVAPHIVLQHIEGSQFSQTLHS